MIKNTYLFLPKIKQKKQEKIVAGGVIDWDDFLSKEVKGISNRTKYFYDRKILEARKALYEGDSSYFAGKLPSTETWRLYDYFREETVFLDIETSSSTSKDSYLTVIGLFDGIDTKMMIRDVNLDIDALKKEMKRYKLIVTFNGSTFDIPYLNKKYPGLIPAIPHIDVRHLCAKLNLKGGLKQIEKELGIKRPQIIDRLYGGDALKLWKMFRYSGDMYYLNLLMDYNEEDIINLKRICEHCINSMKKDYGL